ncbi:hypothetical protein A7985_04110 [Pseudoalteromonas luteoviolacea]|uniref:Uncharacterized protein n=1 Tax=Pseudoalteromonas luteoviolacea TaxID=43657 RepID=A0A1C0TV14_9GAMM|nr:hypothetical protein [Pseudoalteromonas luteoviolacea]OCQ23142.1 hypothetical protein A7985_04110 [Pseudoalteromonas luteoviolacea]
MKKRALSLLPERLSSKSLSAKEVVLPYNEALEVIDFFENEEYLILGWEGWVKTSDGRVGHGSAPQGTVSLENCTVVEAASICRETIRSDKAGWEKDNPESDEELHFCITVRT